MTTKRLSLADVAHETHFTLISRPTLIFAITGRYGREIPTVVGITVNRRGAKGQTVARIDDVKFVGAPAA